MTKTFTCRELGGVCDESFSGASFAEILQKGGAHMMSDEAHQTSIMSLEARTGENKEEWMARMQNEFEVKPEDA